MKFQLIAIVMCLCVAVQVSSADNELQKYMSAKKASNDYLPDGIVGIYKNWSISRLDYGVHIIDVDTGALVKTILSSYTLTGGASSISGAEVVDKYLMVYYSNSVIQKWDLDTGEIVREVKPSISGTQTLLCVWHSDSDMVFCCLTNGFIRKVNMVTATIETEFAAHSGFSFLLLNGAYLFTSAYDGLVKKFDLSGTLLKTFEVTLGYACLLAAEDDYIFVSYYNIAVDLKVRIVRWNHITGIPEEFPIPMSTILDPVSASKDYYFGITFGLTGFGYVQFHKANLSLVHADSTDQLNSWAVKVPSNGERFFFYTINTISELHLSNEGLIRGESINLKYSAPAITDSVVLDDNTMIVVYYYPSSLQVASKFIDLSNGVYSKTIDTFNGHVNFFVSEDLLYAAYGTQIMAYHIANLSLAWKSPVISPQNFFHFEVKDGFIYFVSPNYAGWYNATTFEKIGLIVTQGEFFGVPAFSNGVLYAYYSANMVVASDLTDGRVLKRYAGMPNMITYALVHVDHLYAANVDTFIYKFRLESEAPFLLFVGHSSAVLSLLIRGQIMFSGSRDQTIRKWNIDTGESLFIYYGHNEAVDQLHIYHQKLFSVTDTEVRVWDLNRDRLFKTLSDRSTNVVALRHSGDSLLTCTIDGTISLWNTEKGHKVNDLVKGEDGTFVIGAQWQNNSLFIVKIDGTVVYYNLDEGSVQNTVSGPLVDVLTAFFMKSDMIFVFGAREGLAIKNVTSNVLRRIQIQNYVSHALLVTDRFIFSGNNDSSITKYDVSTLDLLRTIKAHNDPVTVLGQFENQLISGSEDNSLRTWNIDSMNLVLDLKRDSTRLGHLGPITSIHIEGDNLFSGSEDKTVKRWDLKTGKVLFTYTGHIKKVTAIGFNNGSLFTTAEDEVIQIFNVNIVPSISSSSTSSSTLTRIPPRIIGDVVEPSALSSNILIIGIVSAVVFLISLGITCKWLMSKKSNEKSEVSAAFNSGQETVNMATGFEMTLAPTSIGISIPASKRVEARDYIILSGLGKGGGGEVFYAKPLVKSLSKYGDKIVAKRMPKSYQAMSSIEKSLFDQEIGIMEMLRGRGLFVELLGYSLSPCVILMKLYILGSLSAWINSSDKFWSTRILVDFLTDIVTAVSIMHKLQLAHCDLKPDNVLIEETEPDRFTCVLTDFGITQILSESIVDAKAFHVSNIRGLSVRYAAPEAFLRFRKKIENAAAVEITAGDLYSIAAITYEMMAKQAPWS